MRLLLIAAALAFAACTPKLGVTTPPVASSAAPEPAPPADVDDASAGVPGERKSSATACTAAYEHVAAMTCPPLEGRAWIADKCSKLDSTLVTKVKNTKNCHDARETGAF